MIAIKGNSGQTYEVNLSNILGRGAFACVFICNRMSDKKCFAAKSIQLSQSYPLKKAMEEYHMMNKKELKSQFNIITAEDFAVTESNLFIIMPYYSQGNLKKIHSISPIPDELTALEYFRQICYGIMILHKNQIMHRDIKVENILIEPYSDANYKYKYYFAIGDFGLSKQGVVDEQNQTANVGTPTTRAPEVSSGHYGNNADIYSLGVILYYLLSDDFPFKGISAVEIMKKQHSMDKINIVPIFKEKLSKFALSVLEGCLQYNKDNRMDGSVLFRLLDLENLYSKYKILEYPRIEETNYSINPKVWEREIDIFNNSENLAASCNSSILANVLETTQIARETKAKGSHFKLEDMIMYTNIVCHHLIIENGLEKAIDLANNIFSCVGKQVHLKYDSNKSMADLLCEILEIKLYSDYIEMRLLDGSLKECIMMSYLLFNLNKQDNKQICSSLDAYIANGNLPLNYQIKLEVINKITVKIQLI